MKMARQFSVSLVNKPGILANLCRALADEKVQELLAGKQIIKTIVIEKADDLFKAGVRHFLRIAADYAGAFDAEGVGSRAVEHGFRVVAGRLYGADPRRYPVVAAGS